MAPSSSLTQAKDMIERKFWVELSIAKCMTIKVKSFFFYRNHFFILLEGESTGRLLRYDPPTKTTHIVLEGLAFPNGIQLSKDQSFLLFTETTNCRCNHINNPRNSSKTSSHLICLYNQICMWQVSEILAGGCKDW